MKKICPSLVALFFSIGGMAQGMNRTTHPIPGNVHLTNSQTASVIHPNLNPQAIGDTVFVFDGHYFYDWNGTLPGTFNVQTQDIDAAQVDPGLQSTAFWPTSSFVFFYEINPSSPLHYAHADTVFFAGATSFFNPVDTADNWLEMGPIHVPATGGTLKWRHNYPDVNYRDGYEIRINTTGLSSTDFTNAPLATIADNDSTTTTDTSDIPHITFYQRSANVSAYAGQDIYIAVHHNADDMSILFFTDLVLLEGPTGVANMETNGFSVGENIPNPANGSTSIGYSLANSGDILFDVIDITGQTVYAEHLSNQSAGVHRLDFNTTHLSNGMYYYSFLVNGEKTTRKFIVENQ